MASLKRPSTTPRKPVETPEDLPRLSSIPETVLVPVAQLKAHPRNYREHPPDQLAHIIRSIEEHGVYRNVVVARGDVILAGHGVVKALTQMGRAEVPVIRLDIDPMSVQALKLLAGDNEIGHLAEVNDRMFTELLSEVRDLGGLLGTGYDDAMLANLMFVTRGETADQDEAEQWAAAGMPGDINSAAKHKLIISFVNPEDRERFVREYAIRVMKRESVVWCARWPHRGMEDVSALKFEKEATTA